VGLLDRKKRKDNLPEPFGGEGFDKTRQLLGAGRGDEALIHFTNIDLLSIKATKIKTDAAIESTTRIEREAASEFLGLAKDLVEIRNQSSNELVQELFTEYMAHSLTRTANAFDRYSDIASTQMCEIISRPVDRMY
jgi:hypothetical protein